MERTLCVLLYFAAGTSSTRMCLYCAVPQDCRTEAVSVNCLTEFDMCYAVQRSDADQTPVYQGCARSCEDVAGVHLTGTDMKLCSMCNSRDNCNNNSTCDRHGITPPPSSSSPPPSSSVPPSSLSLSSSSSSPNSSGCKGANGNDPAGFTRILTTALLCAFIRLALLW